MRRGAFPLFHIFFVKGIAGVRRMGKKAMLVRISHDNALIAGKETGGDGWRVDGQRPGGEWRGVAQKRDRGGGGRHAAGRQPRPYDGNTIGA